MLSCYLVLKGWSLMGDAISHAVLPGIVIAYIVGLPLALGAFVAGLSCALLTGYLKENSRIKEDTVMGIVFSGMFGFGLVLFTKIETDQHLTHILFGDVLGVTWRDLVRRRSSPGHACDRAAQAPRSLALLLRPEPGARHRAARARAALRASGVARAHHCRGAQGRSATILVIAMLIGPGATAYLLTDNFDRMLPIAVAVVLVSAAVGTVASFHLDGATGACIVLVQAAIFVFAFLFAPKRGLISLRRPISPPLEELGP